MEWTDGARRAFQLQAYTREPGIEGVELVALARHHDDGGSLTELARLEDGRVAGLPGFTARQVNFSELEPGVIRAFHLHGRQTDVWFVAPADRVLAVLTDVRRGSPTEGRRMRVVLGAGTSRLLRIPPGVAHGMKNLGAATARVVYLTDLHFAPDPEDCDEGRLPWDHLGADVWDVTRG